MKTLATILCILYFSFHVFAQDYDANKVMNAYENLNNSKYLSTSKDGTWIEGKKKCRLFIPFKTNNLSFSTKAKCKAANLTGNDIELTVFQDEKVYFTYTGDLENGEFSGEGQLVFSSTSKYDGSFKDGLFDGEGRLSYGGFSYKGNFKLGRLEDEKGEVKKFSEVVYQGRFKEGVLWEAKEYLSIKYSKDIYVFLDFIKEFSNGKTAFVSRAKGKLKTAIGSYNSLDELEYFRRENPEHEFISYVDKRIKALIELQENTIYSLNRSKKNSFSVSKNIDYYRNFKAEFELEFDLQDFSSSCRDYYTVKLGSYSLNVVPSNCKKSSIRYKENGNWEVYYFKYKGALFGKAKIKITKSNNRILISLDNIENKYLNMTASDLQSLSNSSSEISVHSSSNLNMVINGVSIIYTSSKSDSKAKKEESLFSEAKRKRTTFSNQNYLNNFPNGKYASQAKEAIKNLNNEAENTAYQQANTGSISQCNSYLRKYPNGKYVSKIRERIAFLKISNVADVDDFVSKYPNGVYRNDAINKKNRYIAVAKRKQLVIDRSDISTWTLGDRLCSRFNSSGTIEVVLDQWNEDKSKVKVKVIGGATGSTYKGEEIEKNANLWVDINDFYECIGDESVDYKMELPKSYSHNFDVGDKVYYAFSKTYKSWSILGGSRNVTEKYNIKAVINEFSSDKRKAKVKILDNDNYSGRLDGQSVWNGNEI